MSSYLIARLPSHPRALKLIEFMQKNDYSFRVSSNSVVLKDFMTVGGGLDRFQQEEQVHQLVDQLVDDSMVPQVKQEVQDDDLQLGMGISQVLDNLESKRRLKLEASRQNVDSYGEPVYGRPATSVMAVRRDETILGGGAMDSNRIGHDEPIDSKDSVVVEPSFVGNARGSVEFPGNSELDGLEDSGINAEDLMDDFDDEDDVEVNMTKKTMEKKKKHEEGNRATAIQKNMLGTAVGRLLFACPVKKCRSSYKNFEDLNAHMKIHSDEDKKNVFCDVCKKDFPSIDDGLEHIRKREQKECCSCGKKARYITTLLKHHRCHTKEKPHSCGVCKKRFSRKNHAKRHEATHSGKKPFVCSRCDYKANRNDHLKRHMEKIHAEEKSHKHHFASNC